jgi:hypothetical protein
MARTLMMWIPSALNVTFLLCSDGQSDAPLPICWQCHGNVMAEHWKPDELPQQQTY